MHVVMYLLLGDPCEEYFDNSKSILQSVVWLCSVVDAFCRDNTLNICSLGNATRLSSSSLSIFNLRGINNYDRINH